MGGGGITPVHTTLVPDISTIVRNGLQENMNPALNAIRGVSGGNGLKPDKALGGFDGFADLNPFTMKTMDAYVFFFLYLTGILFSKQLPHAPVGQNGCSTAHAPTESNIAESSEPFRIGLQFASSLLFCLAQGQPTAFDRI